jgi:hypothetical protein
MAVGSILSVAYFIAFITVANLLEFVPDVRIFFSGIIYVFIPKKFKIGQTFQFTGRNSVHAVKFYGYMEYGGGGGGALDIVAAAGAACR